MLNAKAIIVSRMTSHCTGTVQIRNFIRYKDRQYKIETETDGIKTRLKSI